MLAPSRVLVTGPHRSGTTIASEIMADQYGLEPVRESQIARPRFPEDSEPDLSRRDVIDFCLDHYGFALQGATTGQWLPDIANYFDLVVVVRRNIDDIRASQMRYRGRHIDDPLEKYARYARFNLTTPVLWLSYEHVLSQYPQFVRERTGWHPRQTSPS